MTVKQLPVLFLSDVVLLPGMVVPIELDEAAQAAVDAAQAGSTDGSADGGELLVAPRLDDRYASYGVVATVEKVGASAAARPPPSSAPAAEPGSAPASPVPAPRCGSRPSRSRPVRRPSGPASSPWSTRSW
jgi:hypothetical protein